MPKTRITYKPEGASPVTWDFDPEHPDWDVAYNTEKVTGWPWEEFSERLGKGSFVALQALIYTFRKRSKPTLTLADVTVTFDEIDVVAVEEPEEDPESGEA